MLVIFLSGVLFMGIFRVFLGNASNIVGPLFILLLIAFVTGGFVTYWCFFTAAVLVEGKSVSDGLGRRGELIHGAWWRIVGTMFAIFLLHFAIGLVFPHCFRISAEFDWTCWYDGVSKNGSMDDSHAASE